MVQDQNLMSNVWMGGQSEEEYLLGYAKYSSNVYPNSQGDLLGSSSDRNMHHEHTRRMGTQEYLRESCYHCIECPTANFLAAFMWRRPLNSAVLATTTHRRLERVSNGTSTQIVTQMIDKCRIKIVQRELYNIRGPSWIRDPKINKKKHCSNQSCICNMFNWFINELTSSD